MGDFPGRVRAGFVYALILALYLLAYSRDHRFALFLPALLVGYVSPPAALGLLVCLSSMLEHFVSPSGRDLFHLASLPFMALLFVYDGWRKQAYSDGGPRLYYRSLQRLLPPAIIALVLSALWRAVPLASTLTYGGQIFLLYMLLRRRNARALNAHILHRERIALFGGGAIVLLSLLATGLLVEIGARAAFPTFRQPPHWYPHHPQRYRSLRPYSRAITFLRDRDNTIYRATPIEISGAGLRDRDYGPKERDEFRILLLGDSYVFGHGIAVENTISRQLEEFIGGALPNKHIRVINGGVSGYGPWQSRDLLHEVGFSLEPDLVIMTVFLGNDVEDTLRRFGLHLRTFHETAEQRFRMAVEERRWNYLVEYRLRRHWRTLDALVTRVGWPPEGELARLLGGTRLSVEEPPLQLVPASRRVRFLELELRQWYPELAFGFDAMWEDLMFMDDDCAKRDIDFRVFSIPPQAVVRDDFWYHATLTLARDEAYDRGKGVELFRDFAAMYAMAYMPVAEAVMDAGRHHDLYFVHDGHFNETGAAFVAAEIARNLAFHYFWFPL